MKNIFLSLTTLLVLAGCANNPTAPEDVDELVNVHDMKSPLREDAFEDSLDRDSVIENSPESSKDYIEVPLVLKKASK